jgi:hypothetical protein
MFDFEQSFDNHEMIPEEFRGLYQENEDKTAVELNPTLAKKLDVSGLTSALDKERKANAAHNRNLKEWTNIGENPADVSTKIKELEELSQKDKEGKVNWDKLRIDLEKSHKSALDAKDEEGKKKDKSLARYLINAEATAAISELKGSSTLLLPHVKNSVKVIEEGDGYVVRVVDEQGDARGNKTGGFMNVRELVQEMKTDAQFLRAFDGETKQGGGTPPGQSKKPVTLKPKDAEKSATQKIADGFAAREGR